MAANPSRETSKRKGPTFYGALLGQALTTGITGEYLRHINAIEASHLALWLPTLVVLGVGVALLLLGAILAGFASAMKR